MVLFGPGVTVKLRQTNLICHWRLTGTASTDAIWTRYLWRQSYSMFYASNVMDSIASSTSRTFKSSYLHASAEFYEKRLKPRIDIIRNSDATLQELVDAAEKVIVDDFAPYSSSTLTYDAGISVQLDAVMTAMLSYAEACGGESGKRYVASAILGCSKEEEVVEALKGLGITWLTHLLFAFKLSSHCGNMTSFADDVKKRDGYSCVVTGFQNLSHPKQTHLIVTHILSRAIGQFDSDQDSYSYKSALTTFDILVNFTRLPAKTLEELRDELDLPSNGMAIQFHEHRSFDMMEWCLKKTEEEHVYDRETFVKDQGRLCMPKNNRITFEDHSNDFLSPSRNSKRSAPIDLPNPHYIEIHAAIAGILNMSGAGIFFDELLEICKDDHGHLPDLRCWLELESLMGGDMWRVFQAFRLVK